LDLTFMTSMVKKQNFFNKYRSYFIYYVIKHIVKTDAFNYILLNVQKVQAYTIFNQFINTKSTLHPDWVYEKMVVISLEWE
jgi:hypothetical protein